MSETAAIARRGSSAPSTPRGSVVCAVGDIHGRLDLVRATTEQLSRMSSEAAAEGKSFTTVFLGDYIDRGPDSRGVIDHLIGFAASGAGEVIFLRGNHEQVLMDVLDGQDGSSRWLDYGGVETLASYGLKRPAGNDSTVEQALAAELTRALPKEHLRFLRGTTFYEKRGDYLFVHAGLRPDRLLEEQSESDMLWFRYYADERPLHGETVVHGHSPNDRPIMGRWRIGIDTEAYASGALTILCLDGDYREFIKVSTPSPDQAAQVKRWEKVDTSYSRRTTPNATAGHDEPPRRRRLAAWLGGAAVLLTAAAACAVFALNRWDRLKAPRAAPRPVAVAITARPSPQNSSLPTPAAAAPEVGAALRTAIPPAAAEAPAPPSPPEAAPKAAPTSGAQGGVRIQVGALRSEAQARQTFDALVKTYPQDMKGKTLVVEPTTVGTSVLYRALVDGFGDSRDARRFCDVLHGANHACLLRPAG